MSESILLISDTGLEKEVESFRVEVQFLWVGRRNHVINYWKGRLDCTTSSVGYRKK
jgi:hypothetical protein